MTESKPVGVEEVREWLENPTIGFLDAYGGLLAKQYVDFHDDKSRMHIMLVSAANSLIGYTSSLTAGTVITQDYIDRLNDHYVPQLLKALNPEAGE